MTHRELGAKILAKLTNELSDVAEVEVAPKMEGYQMFTIFVPKKIKPEKKKGTVLTSTQPNAEPAAEKKDGTKAGEEGSSCKRPKRDLLERFFTENYYAKT